MKTKMKWIFSLAILTLLLAACGKDEVQPVAINEATDTCEVCNMQVMNNEFATQVVLENGRSFVFDDVGCMYNWFGTADDEIAGSFVRDYNDKEWILVENATFVYDEDIKTPMAYNMISFKDEAAAESFIAEHGSGTMMTSEDLTNHSWQQNRDMEHSHDHDHHHHGDDHHGDEHHHDDEHGEDSH